MQAFYEPEKNAGQNITRIAPLESVNRILVCQLRQIGDVLLTTPSIELLGKAYPNSDIHVFTEKKCISMLENNPYVDKIWAVDKKELINLAREFSWYKTVAASNFDLVVDFQQLPRCRAVVALSGARVRLSFPPPWYLKPLYTHHARSEPGYAAAHKAGVLAPLGIVWNGEKPRLYLSEAEREDGLSLLRAMGLQSGAFISVDSTHRKDTRRWPTKHYAALLDMLADAMPDIKFLLPFGPGEEQEARQLRAHCRNARRIVVSDSLLSLRQMAACMEHAVLHIGNCSAPRHIAVAVDVPSFIMLGATSSGWEFPSPEHTSVQSRMFMDMPCQPCNKNACPSGLACLEKLTPALVLPEIMTHLKMYGKFAGRP